MKAVRYWVALTAGLALTAPAAAQGLPPLPRPPGWHDVAYAAVGPMPTPVVPTPAPFPPPGCTCKDRHGLSRWHWHRTRCMRKHQEAWLGYPEEFNEWPLGRAAYANAGVQVANGAAARMVFNDYDFVTGTSALNVRGRDKLGSTLARLPTTFDPIVIERTPRTPGLDQTRRLAILAELAGGPFPVPAERVLIGPPIANGLWGVEALLVNRNRLGAVAGQGGFGSGLGGAGSGVGPGSFDASGLTGSTVTPIIR